MVQLKGWMVMKNDPIRVEDLGLGLEEGENSHTLTTTTVGSKNSQKEVQNQTDNQNSVLFPQRLPLYRFLLLFEVESKQHTQQQISVDNNQLNCIF